ncbi:MDR family MFS transporter [Aspergillus affinis]|uniref:MDR family MFS transporter n=1 Tax=Aspergillus affinis TaxID=1070780 RepID=UPI0022FF032A|nr:uncharacterized protein KD926_008563 [Aspergillus affinis]KAI9040119.1 hypothetical protein KD926_008563 [Aspergillus affinis]
MNSIPCRMSAGMEAHIHWHHCVLVACVLRFEVGSAVCGAAPSSAAFIAGRAIAGVGAAGIFSGSIMCIVYAVPLEKRAQIQGLFGSIFGIASIVGPLIGGAFTSNVTWRWCFYINLPFGGVAVAIIIFCLKVPDRDTTKLVWKDKVSQLDAVGTVILISCMFQSITAVSAVESSIRLLPLMLAVVLASIVGGLATQKAGYYTPFAIGGSWIMTIGAGLLTTLQVDTSEGKWIGYQILYGFGMGLSFQAPNLAAQTVLPAADVPIGSSLMFFGQLLGATIFISVGENVLDNQPVSRLSGMPGFDPKFVTSGGATSLLGLLPEGLRGTALVVYYEALRSDDEDSKGTTKKLENEAV